MALPTGRTDREYKKFVQRADGQTAVAVDIESADQGGGGGGGGNNTYSNSSGDFTATANSGAKTITITGLPFTLEAKHVIPGSVYQVTSAGAVTKLALTTVTVSSGVITLSDMSANFASGDTVVVNLIGPDKAYDSANDVQDTSVNNPEPFYFEDVTTIVNAATADTTANFDVSTAKSVFFLAVSSDTALLHDSIDLKASYDNGSNFYDLPGQAISMTRNMTYGWWVNTASITDLQVNFDEIVSTAGTVTLYMMKSFQEAPNPQCPPYAGILREALVLTSSYVTTNELFIEPFKKVSIISEFTTGATGGTDEWSPNYQIEVSRTRTGDNWEYLNTGSFSTPEETLVQTVYNHAATAPAYTAASTAYKNVIAQLDNYGWKRIRVGVKDESSPSNAGSSALYITAA